MKSILKSAAACGLTLALISLGTAVQATNTTHEATSAKTKSLKVIVIAPSTVRWYDQVAITVRTGPAISGSCTIKTSLPPGIQGTNLSGRFPLIGGVSGGSFSAKWGLGIVPIPYSTYSITASCSGGGYSGTGYGQMTAAADRLGG